MEQRREVKTFRIEKHRRYFYQDTHRISQTKRENVVATYAKIYVTYPERLTRVT